MHTYKVKIKGIRPILIVGSIVSITMLFYNKYGENDIEYIKKMT